MPVSPDRSMPSFVTSLLAEHRVQKLGELALGKDEVHVARQVGLEHLVRAVDEVDVLDAVFR